MAADVDDAEVVEDDTGTHSMFKKVDLKHISGFFKTISLAERLLLSRHSLL